MNLDLYHRFPLERRTRSVLDKTDWPMTVRAWERSVLEPKVTNPSVGVIGIPFSMGQPMEGTEHGPAILRENGLISKIESLGNKVIDYGDLCLEIVEDDDPWNGVKFPRTVGKANKQVADWVAKITNEGHIAVTLGGDHSLAIGSIFGHSQTCPDLVMIWVDAHADINTPLSSYSGNIHGMPLSFVLKEMERYTPHLPGFEWCKPCLSARDLVYIGLRDVEHAERVFITHCNIKSYSMDEVDKYGLEAMMDRLLKSIDPCGSRPIHLSFDVDALDPDYAPSTGTPVPGGLTRKEMIYIANEIAGTGRLSCLDLVEVNPVLGAEEDRKRTVRSAVDVVAHFFMNKKESNVSTRPPVPNA